MPPKRASQRSTRAKGGENLPVGAASPTTKKKRVAARSTSSPRGKGKSSADLVASPANSDVFDIEIISDDDDVGATTSPLAKKTKTSAANDRSPGTTVGNVPSSKRRNKIETINGNARSPLRKSAAAKGSSNAKPTDKSTRAERTPPKARPRPVRGNRGSKGSSGSNLNDGPMRGGATEVNEDGDQSPGREDGNDETSRSSRAHRLNVRGKEISSAGEAPRDRESNQISPAPIAAKPSASEASESSLKAVPHDTDTIQRGGPRTGKRKLGMLDEPEHKSSHVDRADAKGTRRTTEAEKRSTSPVQQNRSRRKSAATISYAEQDSSEGLGNDSDDQDDDASGNDSSDGGDDSSIPEDKKSSAVTTEGRAGNPTTTNMSRASDGKQNKRIVRSSSDGSSKPDPGRITNKGGTASGPSRATSRGESSSASQSRAKGKGRRSENTRAASRPAKLAADVEVVLKKLRKLRSSMKNERGGEGHNGGLDKMGAVKEFKHGPTLEDLGLTGDTTEVREMGAAGVMDEIERIAVEVAESILAGKGFGYRIPTRSSGNQKYVEQLDRIVLGDKVSQRSFVSTAMARKTAITTRVVQLVHQVLGRGIHITKRDMFYTDVKLFKEQGESDAVLDDVACMVGCTRSCLNVVASDKGLVVGRVSFYEDGDLIDCTRMGVGGKAIPPYIDKITAITSDADFILLVEKEAAYMRMAEDRFYQKYPCIVITAKGQPDVATRLFLKRLKRELNIPVMGLVDSDPYGLKILSVYMSGSKNMSYDSASLTTPDIKWLGVRPSDLDRYSIPDQCRLDMTEHDIKTGKELLQEEFIKKNAEWYRELELMIKSKKKAEIQSLSAFGFQYLTETYLPQKLQNGDWV